MLRLEGTADLHQIQMLSHEYKVGFPFHDDSMMYGRALLRLLHTRHSITLYIFRQFSHNQLRP